MSESQESKGVPSMFTDERDLAWLDEHLTDSSHPAHQRVTHTVRRLPENDAIGA